MSGILSKALAGLGKGMVEVGRDRAEQANWEKRQQIQMQGQKDMEVWRQQMAEELRQKMGNQVKTRAQELMAGDPKMTIEKATAMAGGEAMGKFDTGYGIQKDERDFAERKRSTDATIGNMAADNARASEAQRMAREKFNLEMGELKSVTDAKGRFRSLMEEGRDEEAMKLAKVWGFGGNEKIGRFQFKQEEDERGRKITAVYDSTTGMRVGDGGSISSSPKPQDGQKRPPLSAFR